MICQDYSTMLIRAMALTKVLLENYSGMHASYFASRFVMIILIYMDTQTENDVILIISTGAFFHYLI